MKAVIKDKARKGKTDLELHDGLSYETMKYV
jgi:hypothetical protein